MWSYRVVWEIDVTASSYHEAADKAREIQLDPNSIATVFSVSDRFDGPGVTQIFRSRKIDTRNPVEKP